MRRELASLLIAFLFLGGTTTSSLLEEPLAQDSADPVIQIEQQDDRIRIFVNSSVDEANSPADGQRQLFTEYRFKDFAKPILYPVYGVDEVSMVRHYPMDDSHEGEQPDHPHHKSIWFAHGDVNGLDFWSEQASIRHVSIEQVKDDSFTVHNQWVNGSDVVCRDQTTLTFLAGKDWRAIDYSVTIVASEGDLRFGDTKEGTFAIRTHPGFRLQRPDGQATGSATNSQGDQDKQLWGKNAKWVYYKGMIDSQAWSMVMMDHPQNLRHPTTWHAREYGLVAANPFGLSFFQGLADKQAGDFKLEKEESLTLRYRVLFHQGELASSDLQKQFEAFALTKDP